MAQQPDLATLKAEAFQAMVGKPGFAGIGIAGRLLRVYVRTSEAAAHYPTHFREVPLEIVVTGEISTLGEPGDH